MIDRPKSLKDEAEREARIQMLNQNHILSLTQFAERIRQGKEGRDKHIPCFDPLDGGIDAQCLFVLEAPGPKTKDSGFVSRNNNDETAKIFFKLSVEAGIPREKTIIWNIVPWYIYKENGTIRPANRDDINEGLPYLHRLIELLSHLQIIVLVGRKAQRAEKELRLHRSEIDIFHCFHTSPRHINPDRKRNRQVIINQPRQVSRALDRLA